MEFKQPQFYKFSEDSVFLANFLAQHKSPLFKKGSKILDAGSGCGVIGLLLQEHFRDTSLQFHLCELIPDFSPFLKLNSNSENVFIHICDMSELKESEFDLIIFNPPYYIEGRCRKSIENEMRNQCRSITIEKFHQLINAVKLRLKLGGRGFFVYPKYNGASLKDEELRLIFNSNGLNFNVISSLNTVDIYEFFNSNSDGIE